MVTLDSSKILNIPVTLSTISSRVIFNKLESTYTDHTSSAKDWYQTNTVVGYNILNNRLADIQLRRLGFWSNTGNVTLSSSPVFSLDWQQTYISVGPNDPRVSIKKLLRFNL